MQTHERSQSKRPRLLAIHARHDNRCISDQICNRSINRTSNLEFLYRGKSDTIGIDDPAPIDQMRPLSYFFFFPFVMPCFCSILTGIFCAGGFIFESELNIFRKGDFRKKAANDPFASIGMYKSVYFHTEMKISIVRCNRTSHCLPRVFRSLFVKTLGRRKRSDMIWFSQQYFVSLLCHHRHLGCSKGQRSAWKRGLRQNNICLTAARNPRRIPPVKPTPPRSTVY